MNQVSITGTVGKDVEMKYFESGKVKANFPIAVNGFEKGEKTTNWFNIEVWDKQAEFAGEYIQKGKVVNVVGYLESREHNEKKYYTIKANKVGFSSATATFSGIVSEVSKRYTTENKPIISFYLAFKEDQIIRCTAFKEVELKDSDVITVTGNITVKEYKPELLISEIL